VATPVRTAAVSAALNMSAGRAGASLAAARSNGWVRREGWNWLPGQVQPPAADSFPEIRQEHTRRRFVTLMREVPHTRDPAGSRLRRRKASS